MKTATILKALTLGCALVGVAAIDTSNRALAQSNLAPATPEICDIDLALLKSNSARRDRDVVTADTVSPQGTTIPSLWWTNEQLPPKLVTNWIANRTHRQIYLVVNTDYWNILDYIDRYQTIDKFGRVAHSYGYDLKICTAQKIVVASYHCTANASSDASLPCQIWLNVGGQNGMSVRMN